ncbi:1143_t:CDS:2 [Ambispora leptoticha]|uniref:1143_t:CDS:1 n=1 Tax=Ambispora leptoticha TaxID=144679 RepID=A0A9N9C0B8_9GLOM|nr:1143_t:CDS:2 [Ambispora leptoticha]
MLFRYSIFQLPYEQGGLQAPIISNMLEARLLTVWSKLLSSDCGWSRIERNRISNILKEKRNISTLKALTLYPVKTKAWPTEWKPYLMAWKKIEGKINTNLDLLKILRGTIPISTIIPDQGLKWISAKLVNNKKKDIFWRMYHKALPLGYRLRHISSTETGDCPWCSEELQTIQHFMAEYRISKEIWKEEFRFHQLLKKSLWQKLHKS